MKKTYTTIITFFTLVLMLSCENDKKAQDQIEVVTKDVTTKNEKK